MTRRHLFALLAAAPLGISALLRRLRHERTPKEVSERPHSRLNDEEFSCSVCGIRNRPWTRKWWHECPPQPTADGFAYSFSTPRTYGKHVLMDGNERVSS